MAKRKVNPSKQFALAAAKLAIERHCSDVIVLDLNKISPVTDYFVIATGTSDRQIKSIANELADLGKAEGFKCYSMSGYEQAGWVLLDFVDIIVHLFDAKHRDYYQLETLWGDAQKVRITKPRTKIKILSKNKQP